MGEIESCECSIEKCDIFDFMAKYVGLSVLHPGGFKATRKLADACQINNQKRILDIACGKGTSAVFLAEKYGCRVEGVDISEELIKEARVFARKSTAGDTVSFQVGDALNLPYSESEFDVTVSQAMLVLVRDKSKAIQEAKRVIKPGGYAGWIELSWKQQPTAGFLDAVSNEICAYCMTNVLTFEGWEKLIIGSGFAEIKTFRYSMDLAGLKGMIRNEGFSNSVKVMSKYLFNAKVRRRMLSLRKFMNSNPQYFGYGIYVAKKL